MKTFLKKCDKKLQSVLGLRERERERERESEWESEWESERETEGERERERVKCDKILLSKTTEIT